MSAKQKDVRAIWAVVRPNGWVDLSSISVGDDMRSIQRFLAGCMGGDWEHYHGLGFRCVRVSVTKKRAAK